MRNPFTLNKVIVVIAIIAVLIVAPFAYAEKLRPNIVFFIADDISAEDFGCYGHPTIRTPHIDALAERGVRFDQAYLTASSCSPTRVSILTGRYPHNTGAPELHSLLPADQLCFPELLREAGYYSVLSGKNHGGDVRRAFDHILDNAQTRDNPSGSQDWRYIVKNRPKEQPFFFWFASWDAHRGWQINDKAPIYDPKDVIVPPYMVDTPRVRQDLANYYHEVSRFDYYVGQVTDELDRQGVLDNTLIVVAADNGRPFSRSKTLLYDSGIKTPWVVFYPPLIQEAATTDSLVSVIDLSATCLELAGIEKPDSVQGVSFLPIMKDPQAVTREIVFAEMNYHAFREHSRMVRFGDYMYIKNNHLDRPDRSHRVTCRPHWDAYIAGETLPRQEQLFESPIPSEELFQVSKDPHQLRNLIAERAYAEILEQARNLLSNWTKQTGDSIPENPTPDRHSPPRIVDGKYQPGGKVLGPMNPHAEFPGAVNNASKINHPGPLRLNPSGKVNR